MPSEPQYKPRGADEDRRQSRNQPQADVAVLPGADTPAAGGLAQVDEGLRTLYG